MPSFTHTIRNIHQRIGDVTTQFELPVSALTPRDEPQLIVFSYRNLKGVNANYDEFIRSVEIVAQAPATQSSEKRYAGERPSDAASFTAMGSGFAEEAIHDNWQGFGDRAFSRDVGELIEAMIRTRANAEPVVRQRRASLETDYRCVFGVARRTQKLLVNITINTDSPAFLAWTHGDPSRRIVVNEFPNSDVFKLFVNVELFSESPPLSEPPYCERAIVDLRLEPCTPLAKYNGFVAFDFGNNSSTVAYLPDTAGGARDLRQMNLDEKEYTPSGQPSLESKLRLMSYRAPLREDDPDAEKGLFGSADCFVGQRASVRTEGTLIEGLKPLLADPSEHPPMEVELINGQQVVPKGIPAELFLAEMFRSFHRQALSLAAPVTLTYPTTYSRREIGRLCNAVTRAFQRSLLNKKLEPSRFYDMYKKTVGLLVDEATAAAFYYLYRDFLEGPGKTAALRYLYPQGLNILLYDCGGGTTDIALVHAMPTLTQITEDDGRVRETWQVRMSVLGRTGHRTFGGDNITAAMTIAVKWLIVSEIDPGFSKPNPELCDGRLSGLREKMNQILPTAWTQQGKVDTRLTLTELRFRKAATRQLVKFAEDTKVWISSLATDPEHERNDPPDLPLNTELERMIKSACQDNVRKTVSVYSGVKAKLATLRPVVDAMIDADLQLSIRAANNLIRERLTNPTSGVSVADGNPIEDEAASLFNDGETPPALAPDSCIHWVYVVGKASLYPTIVESIRRHLFVSDLTTSSTADKDDGSEPTCRLVLEKEMLKGAVARGAVLLRMFSKDTQDVVVKYDRNLSAKLAFELGIRLAGRGMKRMFAADEFYSKLEPFEFEAAGGAADGQTLRVYRRWPGMEGSGSDNGWEDYLQFAFRTPPTGTVSIQYEEPKSGRGEASFVATVIETGESIIGREVATKMFQSPLLRGDL